MRGAPSHPSFPAGIGYTEPKGKEKFFVANCSCSNHSGCSCNGRNRTCVGALSTLNRSCGYSRSPYYTGPCPPAPCTNRCGTCAANACNGCGCSNAAVTCDASCGCSGCNSCSGCSGCGNCNACGSGNACGSCKHCRACDSCDDCDCDDDCGTAWNCPACGCGNGGSCLNCRRCGCLRSGPDCGGHAVFSADGPIRLPEGGCVGLEVSRADSDYFTVSRGGILIRRPGVYFAAVTVDIPGSTEVDTVLRLELDGRSIAPPEIAVTTNDDETTANYAGHAVFHAGAGSVLRLSSLRGINVGCATTHPVFTLTLFRIS